MHTAHNQRKLSVILLTLVLVLVVGLSTIAETLVVSKDGAYSLVQDAVDTASSGDTVLIKEGTYEEDLTIDKDLTLQGTKSAKTKIDGVKEKHPVLLVGPSEVEVTIEKLTLRGAEGRECEDKSQGICAYGLTVTGESRVSVSQTKITGNKAGLWLFDSARASVEDSQITGNELGLVLYGSAQASVKDSQITRNEHGLWLTDSARASVEDSQINGNGDNGFRLIDSAQVSVKDSQITGNGDNGFWLFDSARASVEDSQITGNDYGLGLTDSARASVKDSRITKNEVGLGLTGSAQASLKNNSLRENDVGIEIYKSDSFSGTINGRGNQISDNKTNFRGVSQKTQETLLSPPDQE